MYLPNPSGSFSISMTLSLLSERSLSCQIFVAALHCLEHSLYGHQFDLLVVPTKHDLMMHCQTDCPRYIFALKI